MAADAKANDGAGTGNVSGYDVFRTAVDAVKAGQDPNVAVYGEGGAPETSFDDFDDGSELSQPEDSQAELDALFGKPGSDSSKSEDSESAESTSEQLSADDDSDDQTDDKSVPSLDVEELVVRSADGRRKKVKVDFTSEKGRTQIKSRLQKSYDLEKGMREFQRERDEYKQKHSELVENWDVMNQAYKEEGLKGLVNLLEGSDSAYDDFEQRIVSKSKVWENASEEERELLEKEERNATMQKALEKERAAREELEKRITSEKEATELKSLESRIHPTFDKYRFAGQLGDKTDEHTFDEMLWNTSMSRLEKYEQEGVDISPALVDREFRAVHRAINKRIGKAVNTKVSKTVQKKKQDAASHAQAVALKGNKNDMDAGEARKLVERGDISGFFRRFGSKVNLKQ